MLNVKAKPTMIWNVITRIRSLTMNAGQLQFARLNLQTLAGEPHPTPHKLMCEPHCTPQKLLALGTFPSTAGAPRASGRSCVCLGGGGKLMAPTFAVMVSSRNSLARSVWTTRALKRLRSAISWAGSSSPLDVSIAACVLALSGRPITIIAAPRSRRRKMHATTRAHTPTATATTTLWKLESHRVHEKPGPEAQPASQAAQRFPA